VTKFVAAGELSLNRLLFRPVKKVIISSGMAGVPSVAGAIG
jgi:hypothetical protein